MGPLVVHLVKVNTRTWFHCLHLLLTRQSHSSHAKKKPGCKLRNDFEFSSAVLELVFNRFYCSVHLVLFKMKAIQVASLCFFPHQMRIAAHYSSSTTFSTSTDITITVKNFISIRNESSAT